MKHLLLKSPNFNYLLESFTGWLHLLGYAEQTVASWPVHVREFLNYLEQSGLDHIAQVKAEHVRNFAIHIRIRRSEVKGTALSVSSINKILQSVKVFVRYLEQVGRDMPDIRIRKEAGNVEERSILTRTEIKALYDATYEPHRQNSRAMGQRDRAIIAVFYGCGLRRDEGIRLNISDIDTVKGLLFVKKGKGNKQRYVPIARQHLEDIKSFLEEGRDWFLLNNYSATTKKHGIRKTDTDDEAFFISMFGKRMRHGFYPILKRLCLQAGMEHEIGLHTLRHSIATHLLQSGMKIEDIARFLGHASLESTQIYTHIVEQERRTQFVNQHIPHNL